MGGHRFTVPDLSQWENVRRSWTQWEKGDNLGFISTGNFKFRSVKLDIFISNTYSVKPLSLSTGKKGQSGAHFNGKYQQEMNFIFQWEITSQIGGRSFWLYEHPHFKYVLCNTFVSQQERRDNQGLISTWNYNSWLISVEKMQKKLNSTGKMGQPGTHFNRKYQQEMNFIF